MPLFDEKGSRIGHATLFGDGSGEAVVDMNQANAIDTRLRGDGGISIGYTFASGDADPLKGVDPQRRLRIPLAARVWAIRHKPTGLYLPERRGKGYSNDEPTTADRPRLFWSERSAKQALAAWLRGKWVCERSGAYRLGPDLGPAECEEEVVVKPQAHRKAEDMELAWFELKEGA